MRGIVERPVGLRYEPEVITRTEETELLAKVRDLPYAAVVMHGQTARRRVRHYGVRYDYGSAKVTPGEPIPDWLDGTRARCATLLDAAADDLREALITDYPPGATIGWHRDAPAFGRVAGVSLASGCLLRFQQGTGEQRHVFELPVEPRSIYALTGASRSRWQHSIPAVGAQRFSITFRTVRNQ